MSGSNLDLALRIKATADGLQNLLQTADSIEAIGGNASELRTQATALQAELERLARQQGLIENFQGASSELDRLAAAMATLQAKADSLAVEHTELRGNIESTTQALENQRGRTAELTAEVQRGQVGLAESKARLAELSQESAAAGRAQSELKQQVSAANSELTQAERTYSQNQAALGRSQDEVVKLATDLDKARDAQRELTGELLTAGQPTEALERRYQSATQRVVKLSAELDQAKAAQRNLSGELISAEGPTEALERSYLQASINVETLSGKLDKAKAAQSQLSGEIAAAGEPTEAMERRFQSATDRVAQLETKLGIARQRTSDLTTSMQESASAVQAAEARLVELGQAQADADRAGEQLTQQLAAARAEVTRTSEALARGNAELREAEAAERSLEKAVEQDTAALQRKESQLQRLQSEISEATTAHRAQADAVMAAGKALDYAGVNSANLAEEQARVVRETISATTAATQLRIQTEAQRGSLADTSAAFQELGIESAVALKQAAAAARSAFQAIRDSGTSSARDVDLAFEAMARAELKAAEAAKPAERAIVAGMLRAQAATDGQRAAVDRLNRELDETPAKADAAGTKLWGAYKSLAALAGVGIGFELIRQLGSLADQAKEVEARLKLSTQGTEEFVAAQQGVLDIAMRTSAALQGTAVLYGRLADAAKRTGNTQEDVLEITEAINQALAISGGNAQAAEAAITQLAQGLAAGALRGEEFNSVAEQAPRLLKVLEDALKVNRGELRKMADEGKLTSEVILASVKGQADVLAEEFAKVPLTLGRAMQQVKTALISAIGELDEATGASTATAEAISAVAKALIDLANDQGIQAGLKALGSLVGSTFDGIGAVLRAAQAAFYGTASAVATAASYIAKGLALINEGETAEKFDGIARSLEERAVELQIKMGDALGKVQENLTDTFGGRGRAIDLAGEALLTYGQKAEAAGAGTDKAKAAAEAAGDAIEQRLGPQVRKLIEDFDAAGKAGSKAGDDIEKVFAKIDSTAPSSIANVVTALDELEAQGKITGDSLDKGIAEFLKNMAAENLPKFQASASLALGQMRDSGQETTGQFALLQAVINQTRDEALQRLGVDAKQILTGIDTDTRNAISAISALGQNSTTTGAQMREAFFQVLGGAQTREEAQQLVKALAEVKVEGFNTADAVNLVKERIQALPAAADIAANATREAFRQLGVEIQADLDRAGAAADVAYARLSRSAGVTAGEMERAFVVVAETKLKAAASAGEYAVKNEAAMLMAQAATDRQREAVRQLVEEHRQQVEALDPVAQAYETLGIKSEAALRRTANEARNAMAAIESSGASVGVLQEAFLKVAEAELAAAAAGGQAGTRVAAAALEAEAKTLGFRISIDEATNSIKVLGAEGEASLGKVGRGMKDQADQAQGFAQAIGAWYGRVNQALREMSEQTQALFRSWELGTIPQRTLDDADKLRNTIRELGSDLTGMTHYLRAYATPGIGELMVKTEMHAAKAALAWHEQKLAAEMMMQQLERNEGGLAGNVAQAEALAASLGLLDQEDLSGLRSAIDDARSRLEAMRGSAESALSSISDELDRLEGREVDIIERRRGAQREEIEEQLQQARDLNDAQSVKMLQEALRKLDTVTQREVADAQAQERERAKTPSQVEAKAPATDTVKVVEHRLPNGRTVKVLASDDDAFTGFIRDLNNARLTST